MGFRNNLSKHQSTEVGLGCSGTKTVAHARPSKLLTQPLMKEGKQWVGFSWTEPFFCPQLWRGGRRRGFVFPSSPSGIDTTRLSSSGEAAGSLFSPLAIQPVTPEGPYGRVYCLPRPSLYYVCWVTNLLSVRAEAPLVVMTHSIFIEHIAGRAPVENVKMLAQDNQISCLVLFSDCVCVFAHALPHATVVGVQRVDWQEGTRGVLRWNCSVIALKCTCQHVCQS